MECLPKVCSYSSVADRRRNNILTQFGQFEKHCVFYFKNNSGSLGTFLHGICAVSRYTFSQLKIFGTAIFIHLVYRKKIFFVGVFGISPVNAWVCYVWYQSHFWSTCSVWKVQKNKNTHEQINRSWFRSNSR